MLVANGHVTVNERVPNQKFHRFVDEQIKEWIEENSLGEKQTEYEVAFFDEDPLNETSCLIVVQSGETLWRAWETADSPRVALQLSLENLRIDGGVDGVEDQKVNEPLVTH